MRKITFFNKTREKGNVYAPFKQSLERDLELYKKYISYDKVLNPSESADREYLIGAAEDKEICDAEVYDLKATSNVRIIIAPGIWSSFEPPAGHVSPAAVMGNFAVRATVDSLEELKMPVYIGGIFSLTSTALKNLKGIPQWCAAGYNIAHSTFESFQGLPDVIEQLDVTMCPNISSIEHFPKEVKKHIFIAYCRNFKFTKEDILKICKCPRVTVVASGVSTSLM